MNITVIRISHHLFFIIAKEITKTSTGADPGFFLGGGAPLRNDVTDGEVKKFQKLIRIYEEESFISGGGGVRTPCTLPLDPSLQHLSPFTMV